MKRFALILAALLALGPPLLGQCTEYGGVELRAVITIEDGDCALFNLLPVQPNGLPIRLLTIETRPDSATGTLTASQNFADGEAVVVGDETYTFETGALDVAGKVDVKATLALSLQALEDAMMGTGTPGTDYHADTVASTSVTASATATTLVVTALVPGSNANTVATTTDAMSAAWGDTTLVDVTDPVCTVSPVDGASETEHSFWEEEVTDGEPMRSVIEVENLFYLVSCEDGDATVEVIP